MPQKNAREAGSRQHREPEFLVVGKLRRAHGVRGEIAMEVYTHFPELMAPGQVVYIGESHHPHTIEKTRWKNALMLLKFAGIDDRTLVSTLTNALVFIQASVLPPLADDTFYYHELIGLGVVTDSGEHLGTVEEILETGANDVLIIQDDQGKERLLPAIDSVVLEIDLDGGEMVVALQEWYGEGD
jgi:16S rRNA processing protein RimM